MDSLLKPLRAAVPSLKVILEHITTADGVDFVRDAGDNWPQLSPRIIYLSTAIIFWLVAFGHIITACRLPSVNVIVWHL